MLPISLTTVVRLVAYVLIAVLVFALLDWLVRTAPFIPEGWKPTLRWALAALGVLVIIGLLLMLSGGGPIFGP